MDLEGFAKNIRGEWAGHEGRYKATGELVKVEESSIPEEFLEWGVDPLGFESNMSMIVRGGTKFYKKHFRILPTVSHFGDMVDLEETFNAWEIGKDGILVFGDGCYTAGAKKVKTRRESRLDKWPSVEFCMRWRSKDEVPRGVHVGLTFDFENGMLVEKVQVVQEKYDTDHCDGSNIEGSSGYIGGWTSDEHMSPDLLYGTWESDRGIVKRSDGEVQLEKGKALYLPRGLDISINKSDDELQIQAGWLAEEGMRLILNRRYDSNGALIGATKVLERRVA